MKTLIITLLLISTFTLLSSCRTIDKLFTPAQVCEGNRSTIDENNLLNPYSTCISTQDEYLKSKEGCKEKCNSYCPQQDMVVDNFYADFAGCHCTCRV